MSIPKHVYAYWCGNNMSWLRYLTLYSLRVWNPELSITLLLSPDINNKKLPERNDISNTYSFLENIIHSDIHIEHVPAIENCAPAQVCDYYQWKILYERGGIFIDMDILFLRPLTELLNVSENNIICFKRYFTIGLIGAVAGTKFIRDLVTNARNNDTANYQTNGTSNIHATLYNKCSRKEQEQISKTRNYDMLSILKREYIDSYYNMDFSMLYRWDYNNLGYVYDRNVPTISQQLGIHWYGGAVESKKWVNLLLPENYIKYNNTLTSCIRKVANEGMRVLH